MYIYIPRIKLTYCLAKMHWMPFALALSLLCSADPSNSPVVHISLLKLDPHNTPCYISLSACKIQLKLSLVKPKNRFTSWTWLKLL